MRVVTNEKLYKRNTRLSLIGNLGGMFLLVGSVFSLFNAPQQLGRYLLLLFLGILFVQVGAYFGRWNRRPDMALGNALRSLDNSYTLYNFSTPVSHLLVGPSGLWILIPRHTRGTITYDSRRKRWKAGGVGLFSRFGQEGIGKPVQDASWEAEALDRYLQKHWLDGDLRVQAALIFVDDRTEVDVTEAPLPTASIKKIKHVLRKNDPKASLRREQIEQLNRLFAQAHT